MLSLIAEEGTRALAVALAYDYSQLAEEHRQPLIDAAYVIKGSHEAAQAAMLTHAAEAGAALIEAKGHLLHGQWADWLKVEFGYTDRTAQNLMNAARAVSKNETFRFLPQTAQYLLGQRDIPDEAVAKVVTRIEQEPDRPVTTKEVKRLVEESRPAPRPAPRKVPQGATFAEAMGLDSRSRANRARIIIDQAQDMMDALAEYEQMTGDFTPRPKVDYLLKGVIEQLAHYIKLLED